MVCNLKKISLSFLIASFLVLFSSCATIPKMPKEMDQAAKTFTPSKEKSNIYIFRDEFIGAAVGMSVDINGQLLGKTSASTFILASVNPGTHKIVSHAENDDSLSITTEAGKNYYIWQEVKMGLMYARTKLHLIEEAKAQPRVMTCDLVGIPQP